MYTYDLFAKFAFYYEKTLAIMVASVSGAILNIILNYIFIAKYGYLAAGYTTLACFMVYSLAHYFIMKKVCLLCCDGDFPYETKRILIIAIPFMITGFVFMLTYHYPIIRYGIVVVGVAIAVIMRNRIINVVKGLLNLNKVHI